MQISEFIQTVVLLPRVERAGVLVVYDPAHRYRELCRSLQSDALQLVDATDSSIQSRESAFERWPVWERVTRTSRGASRVCSGAASRVGRRPAT